MQLVPSHPLTIEISFADGNVIRLGRIGFVLGVWLPLVSIKFSNVPIYIPLHAHRILSILLCARISYMYCTSIFYRQSNCCSLDACEQGQGTSKQDIWNSQQWRSIVRTSGCCLHLYYIGQLLYYL